ncbi:MAG: hypothetical protein IJF60_01390, partial [Agathobacter sp.]|nr:hypothetical protein [Agathobacter sp.]
VNESGEICSFLNLVSDGGEPEQYYLEKDGSQPILDHTNKFYYLMFFKKRVRYDECGNIPRLTGSTQEYSKGWSFGKWYTDAKS